MSGGHVAAAKRLRSRSSTRPRPHRSSTAGLCGRWNSCARYRWRLAYFPSSTPICRIALRRMTGRGLAMPVATPITEALEYSQLVEVVAALAGIASTLARLRAEHNVAHRDLKPGNLYFLDGQWLVGDFGLIALPSVEELTRNSRRLGPAHYIAYELILDPADADPFPADVYSLGKTLWVLATGLGFPPEGHQPADTRSYSINDLAPHANAAALDRVVDRATRLHAEERPTMQEVANDLASWHKLGATPRQHASRTRRRAHILWISLTPSSVSESSTCAFTRSRSDTSFTLAEGRRSGGCRRRAAAVARGRRSGRREASLSIVGGVADLVVAADDPVREARWPRSPGRTMAVGEPLRGPPRFA